MYPADVVLFEGILVFYTQEVRDMFHMKLFVDTDSDVRLSRRGTAQMIVKANGSHKHLCLFMLCNIHISHFHLVFIASCFVFAFYNDRKNKKYSFEKIYNFETF